MLSIHFALVTVAFCSLAFPVVAQSVLTEEQVIQMRLKQEGLLSGKPDGKIGPKTKAAMEEFAKLKGVGGTKSEIIEEMVKLPFEQSMDISKSVEGAVIEAVSAKLRDPMSAKIEIDRAYPDGAGYIAVCGTVNAKNLYGAYVGEQAFQALADVLPVLGASVNFVLIDDNDATLMCSLGTSFNHFVSQ